MTRSTVLSSLTSGSKASESKAEKVTLADIVGGEAFVQTLTMLTGSPATEADATAIGAYSVNEMRALLKAVAKAATAAEKALTPEDVRVSTKDGKKAWGYVTLRAVVGDKSHSVNVGQSFSDGLGEALAKHASR